MKALCLYSPAARVGRAPNCVVPTALAAGLFWSATAFAAPPPPTPSPSVSMVLTWLNSTGPTAGTNNVAGQTEGTNERYVFSISNGGSLTVTIPVQICATYNGSNYTGSWSFDIVPNSPTGEPLLTSATTVSPPSLSFSGTEASTTAQCQTMDIVINNAGPFNLTDPASAQGFQLNLTGVSDSNDLPNSKPSPKLNVNPTGEKNLHVHLDVNPTPTNTVNCYMTDADGNFLLDANGNPVTVSGSGFTTTDPALFTLVVNKKQNTEVATNPGQFDYNLTWWNNTGADILVDVGMLLNQAAPQGANAVHAFVYGDSSNPTIQQLLSCAEDGTDCVGTPEGSSGNIPGLMPNGGTSSSIPVPAGDTLLVEFHVDWIDLSKQYPAGLLTNPSVTGLGFPISVAGTLKNDATGSQIGKCTAGAWGIAKL
jgi:hypothetical protein